ncbi:MAG: class I SAM-dependent methyltransferase, partial [Candidatus Hydrogenedentota bacterium]
MMVRELLDCAQTFDLEQDQNTEDIAFFIEIARRTGGPLLELGCGAGRLAIPLARSGVEVIALDISASMLECFNRRLEREPPSVRSRIKLIRADMRRFALKRRFRGAILSSNTLLLLASEKSVGQALACVGSHLAPDGEI